MGIKITADDSRQSVNLKWKLRKALEENMGESNTGLEFGKDVSIDGKLHLNELSDIVGPSGSPLFTNDTQENVSSELDSILSDYMVRKYAGTTVLTGVTAFELPIPSCVSLGKTYDFSFAYANCSFQTEWDTSVASVEFKCPDVKDHACNFGYAFSHWGSSHGKPFDVIFSGAKPTGTFSFAFYNSNGIKGIHDLDFENVTDLGYAFASCSSLVSFEGCSGWKRSFDVSQTALEHDALVELIGQLETVTTARTLTLGDDKLALLSDEEKLGATNKGWTLA